MAGRGAAGRSWPPSLIGFCIGVRMNDKPWPPILRGKHPHAPSVFTPDALLREARRQKRIEAGAIPEICFLDPDGDIARHLRELGRGRRHSRWACYHTELLGFEDSGMEFGIVEHAVGSSFAVLVAEQLFASGCRLLVSMTSSGADHAGTAAALLHHHRQGVARRRYQLSLSASGGLQRGQRRSRAARPRSAG